MEPDSEDWDKEAIEFHHVDEERLNERIKALIEWEDKENNTYSPAKLPRTGDWAQGAPLREVAVSMRMAERKDKGHLQKFLKRHTSDSIPDWDNVKFTSFQAKKSEAEAKLFENISFTGQPEGRCRAPV